MNRRPEICHAGFFVKEELWQQEKDGLVSAENLNALIETNWEECL